MPRQAIHVTFDPSANSGPQFSFSPERAVLQGATSVVDVVLETRGLDGAEARFSSPEAILWKNDGPDDLTEDVNSARTRVTLQGFPMDQEQAEIDYGYAVQVEYDGEIFSSYA
ncbi:MAG: hypothetical protein AAF657_40990, partial [Acidobacteriota bacterium]